MSISGYWSPMPVRQDIQVLPGDESVKVNDHIVITSKGIVTDKPLRGLRLGWTVKETIGVAVVNPRGISMGKKVIIGS